MNEGLLMVKNGNDYNNQIFKGINPTQGYREPIRIQIESL